MTQRLENHVKYFFNCKLSMAISYYKSKNLPVDIVFYNCYMSSDNIFRQAIAENKRIWQCDFPLKLSGLSFFGFQETVKTFDDFDELQNYLYKLSQEGKGAFIAADNYYLKHRNTNTHSLHTIAILDVTSQEGKKIYVIQDFDPNYYGEIDSGQLKAMIDNETLDRKQVSTFDFNYEVFKMNYLALAEKFNVWVENYYDNFSFYEHFINSLTEIETNNNILDCYDQAFSLLSGSRLVFNKFLNEIKYSGRLNDELLLASQLASNIKMMLLKLKVTGKTNIKTLEEKGLLLRNIEKNCFELIKSCGSTIVKYIEEYEPDISNTIPTSNISTHNILETELPNRVIAFLEKYINCKESEDLRDYVHSGYEIIPPKGNFSIMAIEDKLINGDYIELSLLLRDNRTKWTFPQIWRINVSYIQETIYIKSVEILV